MTQVDSNPSAGSSTGDGKGPDRSRTAVPSPRKAFIVVAIAAGIILLFGIVAVLEGGSTPRSVPQPTHVAGSPLTAEPATGPLRPIETAETPPPGVLAAVAVPRGATRTGATPWKRTTQFSATVDFKVPASQAAVVAFYRSELKARGWSSPDVSATQPPKGAREVLAQRASSDGWYWEIGVVVSPTTAATHGNSRASITTTGDSRTKFSLELYEVPSSQ